MRQGWKQVVLAIVAVAGTAGHEAVAAVCFPNAGGVPGEGGSGPPNWWSAGAAVTGSGSYFADDPRWRGALADIVQNNKERFRVVVENTGGAQYLVMSWQVWGDPGGADDRLYFGVWDDASNTGNVYRLTRKTTDSTSIPAGASFSSAPAAFEGEIFGGAGVLGSVTWTAAPGSALPTWLTDDARVDVICTTPPSTGCDKWVFRIRAKIDPAADTTVATPSGIKISTATPPATRNFRFWYELQDSASIGTTLYSFPPGLSAATEAGPSFPDPNDWKQAQLGSSLSCDGDILFNSSDVYVNTVGSNLLDLTSNDFHATPMNNVPVATRASIPNSALYAKFRVANWGSAGYDSPEWTTACQSGSGGGPVLSGNEFDLSCTWTGFDACAYQPADAGCGATAGTKDRHQCVLVDLGILVGLEHFVFSAQSVYRNMNFDVNSTLVRQATIDIKGLGPMPGGAANRDVFLYVHTNNMPAKIGDAPLASPAGNQAADRRGNILPPRQRFKELDLPATGAIGTKESARIQAAVQAGKLTLEQVEEIMPTYIVYVWHDTGRTLATAAGPSKILAAQPSFGLFLAHDGAIEGWKHQLTAAGGVLVGPDLYKFSPPNDSTFPVTITIEPIEPIDCTGLRCVPAWIWILAALLLLILILYILFRKKQPPPPAP